MKHYLYLPVFLLAGFFLGSCAEDAVNGGEPPVPTDDAALLKVSFRNGTTTRALGDPFGATDEEKTITKLSFYVYPEKEADRRKAVCTCIHKGWGYDPYSSPYQYRAHSGYRLRTDARQ